MAGFQKMFYVFQSYHKTDIVNFDAVLKDKSTIRLNSMIFLSKKCIFILFSLLLIMFIDINNLFGQNNRNRPLLASRSNDYISFSVDGIDRQYILYIPTGYESKSIPLIIVLHGTYGTGRKMRALGFDTYADKYGFAVAYPDAYITEDTNPTARWNDGRGTLKSSELGIDDVYFIKMMIAHINKSITIDKSRIYVTGASNGGIMAYRLALEASDLFAAVAPVIANIPEPIYGKIVPSSKISILTINGTDDPFVPFNGGEVCSDVRNSFCEKGYVVSYEKSINIFVQSNGCSNNPISNRLEPIVEDGTWVEKREFQGCLNNCEVVSYIVHGGGHTWPPHRGQLNQAGKPTGNLDATKEIVNFFLRHTKQ